MAFGSTARVAAFVVLLPFVMEAAVADEARPSGDPVFDRTVELVEANFFSVDALAGFREAVKTVEANAPSGDAFPRDAAIATILGSLKATHTARYTPDRLDYYELADVFRYAIRDNVRRLFPPDGKVTYEGIGIATRVIDGGLFVTDIYDGGPAARAGLMTGDEVLSVDGAPFSEIGSFKGKEGVTVAFEVRRRPDAAPIVVPVKVERLQPLETFLKAISGSVRMVERDGKRIGIVHLWSYTSDEMTRVLYDEIGGGRLKDVDGIVLDLRSRWGGAPADAAETFVGGSGDMTMTGRDGDVRYTNVRWHKPVVAIVDEGTRSGMEILAYGLKKNGIPLVGVTTAKAVVAATGYMLPDDSLLVLAVSDVHVDGKRLEGVGVDPDIVVPFDIRYANGADPQMAAALDEMERRLAGGVN
jgi:carboxyl-terminal processing protease